MDYSSLNDQEIKALLMQYDSEMRKLSFQMQIIQSTIQKLHESLNVTNTEIQTQISIDTPKNEVKAGAKVEISTPKVVSGIEYPKKRTPKIDLESVKEAKKRGPKPKNTEIDDSVEVKEPKKRGRKPKNTELIDSNQVKVSKKRGPKPKNTESTMSLDVNLPKKRGPKPKYKNADSTIAAKNASKGKKKGIISIKRKYTKENPWPDFVVNTLNKFGHLMSSAQLYELAEEENNSQNYGLDLKELRAMISRAFHQLSANKKTIVKFDIKGSKSYNYGLSGWVNETGEVIEKYLP
jgi:hypothetical protein